MGRPGRQSARVRSAAALAIVLCPFLLAACGKSTIRPVGAERSIVDVVSRQTGFRPTDVRCPSGIEAKVGGSFECHFTGPDGRPYTAFMRITEIQGERVIFDVSTRPTG